MAEVRTLAPCCRLCHFERSGECRDHAYRCRVRFFTPLRSVQNDMAWVCAFRSECRDLGLCARFRMALPGAVRSVQNDMALVW